MITMIDIRSRLSLSLVLLGGFAIGCSGAAKSQLNTATPGAFIRHSDGPVTFSVLPYSAEMEEKTFGVDLGRQLALELKVDNAAEDSAAVVAFRLRDIQLVSKDGTRRAPLDPLAVYEGYKVDVDSATMLFGLIGAAVATSRDEGRRHSFTKAALYEVRLDSTVRSASGVLFFDWAGILPDLRGSTLVIEYQNSASSSQRRTVEIAL